MFQDLHHDSYVQWEAVGDMKPKGILRRSSPDQFGDREDDREPLSEDDGDARLIEMMERLPDFEWNEDDLNEVRARVEGTKSLFNGYPDIVAEEGFDGRLAPRNGTLLGIETAANHLVAIGLGAVADSETDGLDRRSLQIMTHK
ncbi:hypothetical protein BLNAU_2225 [Blattamonas nauphoetae]|uniref:Uncharacterized protein n=1 Tax=Blattamonas nauphoetae TaxID=2049346 RepID=A0ABQ9YGE0_9EUKA|nr:hypothetical protein BLNAU_2225 [Blattamonas nauphoetae]